MKSNDDLRGAFERKFEKMVSSGMDLENPPADILEQMCNSINTYLEKNNYSPFTKSEFKELFETFAKQYIEKEEN